MTSRLYSMFAGLAVVIVSGVAIAQDAPAPATTEKLPEGITIVAVEAFPAQIELKNKYDYRQLLLTGKTAAGDLVDVTRIAALEATPDCAVVNDTRLVRAKSDGGGELRFRIGELTVAVPVAVHDFNTPYRVSFVQDVMPSMSKLGCNAGTCHGSDGGKNGFKLSLRGYDAITDHAALTDELAGRRFNRSAPDQSLMLLKPSGGVPHVGGVLSRPGDPAYDLLREWIAAGVELDKDAPRVASIELLPKNPQLPLPGMKQQMVVLATYSDGRVRDVTAEAFVDSSLSEIAEINKQGLVTAVRRGEAAALARFEGNYAACTITVMGDRAGFAWEPQPEFNFIDKLVDQKLERMKILPSGLCTDADFIRRVSLDLTGLPPTPEAVRAFLADTRETRVKRDELVDRLIGSDEYVENWTNKWADLLQVNRRFLSEKGAWALRNWIREAIAHNVPYDQFAHNVLTASGSTFENPPASYMRTLREPADAMENSTQLFLGVRFNCNKCHDHPFERWTQNQYYHLAAYFAQVGRKPGDQAEEEIIYDTHGTGEVAHVKTGLPMAPAFPYQPSQTTDPEVSRREQFANWVTSKENQYFATSYVNRLWSYLLGVGLIEPIDDIRAGNPPSNPELLKQLTDQFIASGFNTQEVLRSICKSRVYQQSIETNRWNEDDQINYSHALARRLPAEILYDTVNRATGSPSKLPGVPSGYRASQLPDSSVELPGGFLGLFGRPPRESACECERSSGVILGQALNLVNGPVIADAIAHPHNRITQLVNSQADDGKLVEELFVSILCRLPTEKESAAGIEAIKQGESRLGGAQDLAWALINSPSFLFNH